MSAALKINRTPEIIAAELLAAKKAESAANAARVALEAELVGMLGAKEEGAQTHNLDGFKVVIEGKLSRSIDFDLFDEVIAGQIPEDLRPIKVKRELDATGVKYLQRNEPDLYDILAKALTVKPAKTAVTVTRVD